MVFSAFVLSPLNRAPANAYEIHCSVGRHACEVALRSEQAPRTKRERRAAVLTSFELVPSSSFQFTQALNTAPFN